MPGLVEDGDGQLAAAMATELTTNQSESHRKEADFIRKKRFRNLFEGVREGNVEVDGLSPEELVGIAGHFTAEMKIHAQLVNPRAKPQPRALFSAGQFVFIDRRVDISDVALGPSGLVRCTDPSVADTFVVPDLSTVGQRILLRAGLNGSTIAPVETIISAGQRGPATVFKRATSIKRVVWMSDNFIASHPNLAAIVHDAVARRGSKWVMSGSRAEFVARATTLAVRTPTQPLAIINMNERADVDS